MMEGEKSKIVFLKCPCLCSYAVLMIKSDNNLCKWIIFIKSSKRTTSRIPSSIKKFREVLSLKVAIEKVLFIHVKYLIIILCRVLHRALDMDWSKKERKGKGKGSPHSKGTDLPVKRG